MFNHILMPTDGSQHSERAVERGIQLAKLCGAKVTGIHVMQDHRFFDTGDGWIDAHAGEQMEQEARGQAAAFLSFVHRTADAAGVPCQTLVATNNHPFDAIVDAANESGCDLIVMTSRCRKGLVSMVMGSGATRVLHRSSIPVLTFRALMSSDHPDKGRRVSETGQLEEMTV